MTNYLLVMEPQFLHAQPDSSLLYLGIYSPTWVLVSVSLAILSCFTTLRAAARTEQLHNSVSRLNWGLISGLTMGIGIWAMHFIGMLALSLPCRVAYDPFVTLISPPSRA
jgi:NO-binding membrane sensor protein with MHYT domain